MSQLEVAILTWLVMVKNIVWRGFQYEFSIFYHKKCVYPLANNRFCFYVVIDKKNVKYF